MENRRTALKKAALLVGAGLLGDIQSIAKPRLRLGACDWTLGARLSPEAFKTAKAIGLQGVQVSYNTSEDERGLSYQPTLEIIQEAALQTGVQVASLAIGELNRVPYKSEARTEEWVWKSIDAAKTLGVKVILLAFFNKGDLRNDPAGREAVTERLRKVAPYAEQQGITLGIESYLSADEHLTILRNVNSKAVKVYYDFRNSSDAGHAVYDEIGCLGRKNICEIHMKENGQRLGEGTLDWPRIAKALQSAHYEGWMQIEWACPKESTTVECHRHNREYLESLFRFS
jgi:L-ribulose-5-phosphate 3-epimerase